jgi:hypothetical protein
VHRRVTRAGKEANPTLSRKTCVMSGETGNLMVKVDVKENVKEDLMMANTELLEVWVSPGKANSVSDKANRVIRIDSGLPGLA